jgi:hypothetical protein
LLCEALNIIVHHSTNIKRERVAGDIEPHAHPEEYSEEGVDSMKRRLSHRLVFI